MASSSGASTGSEGDDLQQVMDQRKRKRMLSNRESARRSRVRKQKHVDDLMAQVCQLTNENSQIHTTMNITLQHYMNIEAENSVLRAQMAELSHRLESLSGIINYINSTTGLFESTDQQGTQTHDDNSFMNPWSSNIYVNQPIMASADMFM
ncbi:bZIP transcription factor 11-like [Quercus robur]|uniref:bZIP transcription factor 11-like n=1 Tax=Quercus robur TaxID=38942 RepID=UPI002163C864|nr:bZIP transcription factor 11-like [Quercus robur]